MKKIVLSCIILLVSVLTIAQNKKANYLKTPEQRASAKTEQLNSLVSLNEEQKSNVFQIYLKQEMKHDIDSQDYIPESEGAKKAEAERREYVDTHIKMVLSEKQFEKLMQHRKELLKKRKTNKLEESDI